MPFFSGRGSPTRARESRRTCLVCRDPIVVSREERGKFLCDLKVALRDPCNCCPADFESFEQSLARLAARRQLSAKRDRLSEQLDYALS